MIGRRLVVVATADVCGKVVNAARARGVPVSVVRRLGLMKGWARVRWGHEDMAPRVDHEHRHGDVGDFMAQEKGSGVVFAQCSPLLYLPVCICFSVYVSALMLYMPRCAPESGARETPPNNAGVRTEASSREFANLFFPGVTTGVTTVT